MVGVLHEHWTLVEGAFQSHHGLSLVEACFGPAEVGIRRLWALLRDIPAATPAGRAMGAWGDDDELRALLVEFAADSARTQRVIASLLMPTGKTYDADQALKWPHPNRPEPSDEPAEMTFQSIDAAINAALPRG